MLQSEYDAIVREKRLKVLLIILTAIVVALVLFVTIKFAREYLSKPTDIITGVKDADIPPKSFPEPTKTEFGTAFPTDFPADIPVEKDVKFTQSYILDYPGQKQLSIVFDSTKTVKENYVLYSDYVKKDGWTVVSKQEKDDASFLYAVKEGLDMSVLIGRDTSVPVSDMLPFDSDPTQNKEFPPSIRSQVSVSVLKK